MTDKELITALHQISPVGSQELKCLGCGHEHNCTRLGCKIIREAAARLKALTPDPASYPLAEELPGYVPGLVTEAEP